ncbi:MAG TPA: pantoate--beta-alanine ligase [Balneolales bacterium]|nr:pantoate--beta-alanine ligase [Balneolales bacterium]
MRIIKNINEIRDAVKKEKREGRTVALVPTMGALHDGHLSLIRKARETADAVVVSVYVNPTQFAPNEDFDAYPRQLEEDAKTCEKEGVSYVFAPDDTVIYTKERFIRYEIDGLRDHLCGRSRPHHFQGVLLIVSKLFHIVNPDYAVFGQKDIQQFRIIERMVKELNFDIQIIMGETVRATDGLALSSRNQYLSDSERSIAPGLYHSLKNTVKNVTENPDGVQDILKSQEELLKEKGFKIDYLDVVDYETLQPVNQLDSTKKYIVAGAVYLSSTRLIDNIIFTI